MSKRTERWISTLMSGLEQNVDEETCAKILEQCGRQCQNPASINKAKRIYAETGDMRRFLEKLSKEHRHLHLEGDKVYLVYPKCYCSRVSKMPKGELSKTYCLCSLGWAKALFEGALGRPVEVRLEKSVIGGDDECRLRVAL
jgi:nitrogenase molybdenum-iron protein alpha/beta subunit